MCFLVLLASWQARFAAAEAAEKLNELRLKVEIDTFELDDARDSGASTSALEKVLTPAPALPLPPSNPLHPHSRMRAPHLTSAPCAALHLFMGRH